nr:helix-turn-helix transcriptional regulator [Pseudopedobacter sp.]
MVLPENDFQKIVGERLRGFRSVQRLKQIDLAETLGIYQSQYSRIESGEVSLSLYYVIVLMDKYDLNPSFIFRNGEKMIDVGKRKMSLEEKVDRYEAILRENNIDI